MEVPTQNEKQSGDKGASVQVYSYRQQSFEINEHQFKSIHIDSNRLVAKGKSWETCEILISFIGAAWMEKWRRFGLKLLGVAVFMIILPFMAFMIPGMTMLFWGPAGTTIILLFWVIAIVLVIVWIAFKREALMLYTPGGSFKIEGSASFIESVWKAVTEAQRIRDV
ncbi:MAG: hypothetical protein ACFFCP_17160 [Promethearchaeota archaeon]